MDKRQRYHARYFVLANKLVSLVWKDEGLRKILIALISIYPRYREERLRGLEYREMDAIRLELMSNLRKQGLPREVAKDIAWDKVGYPVNLLDEALILEKGKKFLKLFDKEREKRKRQKHYLI